jgi:RNA polymerase sigma-70 factor (ECF subfamily)
MSSSGVGLRELIDSHYSSLYRYAYRLVGNENDAADLTQEAFTKAMGRLHQLREPQHAKAWLFRILRNAYLHRLRDERRHQVLPLDSVGDLAEELPDLSPTTEIDPGSLQVALNELDETFRTPLILFYFEDFSYRDIAEQMDLPIGTVMSRLARAKGYLRERLFPRLPPETDAPRRANHGL